MREPADIADGQRAIALALIGVLLGMVFLAPVLHSGFMGDDAINSLLVPARDGGSGSLLAHTVLEQAEAWATIQGRLFILSYFGYVTFYVVNGNVLAYKWLVILVILVDILLFSLLMRRLTGSWGVLLLCAALPVAFMQTRIFHDAILGFSGLLPTALMWVLLSLMAFESYLRESRRWQLMVSLGSFICAMLTYEVTLPLFLVHIVMAARHPDARSLRAIARVTWPFAAAAASSVAITVVLRLVFGGPTPGESVQWYTPKADAVAYVSTLVKQVVAAFPLSYHAYEAFSRSAVHPPPQLFEGLSTYVRRYPVTTIGTFLAFSTVAALGIRRLIGEVRDGAVRPGWVVPAGIGACLLVLPAAVIALSPRWQEEVFWGVGYLPVFISYFGVAALIIALAMLIARIRSGRVALTVGLALAVLIGTAAALTFQDNRMVIEAMNGVWRYPREMELAAAEAGVFEQLRDGDTIVVGTPHAWDLPDFYEAYAGVRSTTVLQAGDAGFQAPSGSTVMRASDGVEAHLYPASARVMYVAYDATTGSAGHVLVGRIESLVVREGRLAEVTVADARYCRVDRDQATGFERPLIRGVPADPGVHDPAEVLRVPEDELVKVASDGALTLYDVPVKVSVTR